MSEKRLEGDCLTVLMRHDGKSLTETEVRDALEYKVTRAEVRQALKALVNTRRAISTHWNRTTQRVYMSAPIGVR